MIINFAEYKSQNKTISVEQDQPKSDKAPNFDCFKNKRKEVAIQRAIQRAEKLAW